MALLTRGLAQYLGAAVDGLAYSEGTDEGNVFLDDLPSTPDTAVGVYAVGGTEADTKLGYEAPRVQIIIRGTEDPINALVIWRKVYSALHALRNYTLPDGTYLVWCIVTTSAPVRMAQDENGRRKYAMNLRTEITATTTNR